MYILYIYIMKSIYIYTYDTYIYIQIVVYSSCSHVAKWLYRCRQAWLASRSLAQTQSLHSSWCPNLMQPAMQILHHALSIEPALWIEAVLTLGPPQNSTALWRKLWHFWHSGNSSLPPTQYVSWPSPPQHVEVARVGCIWTSFFAEWILCWRLSHCITTRKEFGTSLHFFNKAGAVCTNSGHICSRLCLPHLDSAVHDLKYPGMLERIFLACFSPLSFNSS